MGDVEEVYFISEILPEHPEGFELDEVERDEEYGDVETLRLPFPRMWGSWELRKGQ